MKSQRSVCPISCFLDIIGDRWTLILVRDLFAGKTLFKEFLNSPEKIATNILTNRLKVLLNNEIIEKFEAKDQSTKRAYRLTDKGLSLKPVLKSVAVWGLTNIQNTKAKKKFKH